jgi:transposase
MAYKTGVDRDQLTLIPLSLEDSISPDNAVRVVDAFVDCLDLKTLGFTHATENEKGASSYAPTTLLKLYLYGYLNRIRSSRRLATECRRNIELHWLLCRLTPQYHTIADFRKDNPAALKGVFKEFTQFCMAQKLIEGETVAIDGTKIQAQNNQKNNFNAARLEKLLNRIETKTQEYEQYLKELDEQDQTDDANQTVRPPLSMPQAKTKEEVEKTLKVLKERRIEYQNHQNQLQKAKEQGGTTEDLQISTVDPDARQLSFKGSHTAVGYNIQTVGDAKNSLVAHFEVTNVFDLYALSGLAIDAKTALSLNAQDSLKALADAGYHLGSELTKCIDNNIQTFVSPTDVTILQGRIGQQPLSFSKDQFKYDALKDVYICPNNQQMTSNGTWYERKKSKSSNQTYKIKQYTLPSKVCQACPFAEKCQGKRKTQWHGKTIEHLEHQAAIQKNTDNLQKDPKTYQKRKEIIEHPFGTIKRSWGYNYTLLRTKKKVAGEFALIFLCYNIRRAISIMGVKALIQTFKNKKQLIQILKQRTSTIMSNYLKKLLKIYQHRRPIRIKTNHPFNCNINFYCTIF